MVVPAGNGSTFAMDVRSHLMTFVTLAAFVGIASYLQTLTGFAFALVFMSAIAMTGAIGIEEGAFIATLLMLVNATLILSSERRSISVAPFVRIAPLALIGTIAGTLLLPILLARSVVWLKFSLGIAVILSSLRLIRIPKSIGAQPSPLAYPLSGFAGGIMGGLFAVPGPPIVYVLHRYLSEQREIRATLVAIFAVISIIRLIAASISALPPIGLLLSTLMLVPVTIVSTEIARRWPPPLSTRVARTLTVLLLVLTGTVLVIPALAQSM